MFESITKEVIRKALIDYKLFMMTCKQKEAVSFTGAAQIVSQTSKHIVLKSVFLPQNRLTPL
jgi:hypothetical protein